MDKKIEFIAFGYCSNDFLCRVPEIPIDTKRETRLHMIQGGGPAATSAVTAARLGMRSAFAGVVGDDDSGKRILADLKMEKVDVSFVRVRENCDSSTAFCWVDDSGRRSIVWYRGTGKDLAHDEIPFEAVRNAAVIHFDGHQIEGAIEAAAFARKHGVLTSIDAGTLRPGVEKLIQNCDLALTSEEFAKSFTGCSAREETLDALIEKLPSSRVTGFTCGPEGVFAFDRKSGKKLFIPSFKVEAVDTTGAGDVFHSAFACFYARTLDTEQSLRKASACAAVKCTMPGGRTGIPTLDALEKALETNQLSLNTP